MAQLATFTAHRELIFAIAYRMLGSVRDAEDLVQDAYLRWQDVKDAEVREPRAYLITLSSRLSIDRLRALKREREHYIGPWLPEPLLGAGFDAESSDPQEQLHSDQTLRLAVLRLLEHLTPQQRATYVLREAFDQSFAEIGEILNANVDTCRQWYRRAQQHLEGATRFESAEPTRRKVVDQLILAIQSGDVSLVASLLTQDVEMHTDGGGKVNAAIRVVTGPTRIAQMLLHLWKARMADLQISTRVVNGLETALLWEGSHLDAIFSVEVVGNQIQSIDVVRNPDKLQHMQ